MPRNFESDEPSFNLVRQFAGHFDRHLREARVFTALQAVASGFGSADLLILPRHPLFEMKFTLPSAYFDSKVLISTHQGPSVDPWSSSTE
jgi:hypothetical protein